MSDVALVLCALLLTGAGMGLAFFQRHSEFETARLIDQQTNSSDLFLTAAMIQDGSGDYRPLVMEQAGRKAAELKASRVFAFHWQPGAMQVAGALAALFIALAFLPHFDPFGKAQQRQQAALRQTRLDASRQNTLARLTSLRTQTGAEERVDQAIADLEKTLQQAIPNNKEANLQRLVEHQKELGQLWRQVDDAELKQALQSTKVEQSFGRADPQQAERLKEALRRGDVSELKKELEQLKEKMDRAAAMPESAQKQQERERLQRQLGALADTVQKGLKTPGVNTALGRAMDQLNQGQSSELSSSALKAAGESLDLSAKELESLAQTMRDMSKLDDAIKSTQLAKQLNEKGGLDGKECADCKSIGDYAKQYARSLGQRQGEVGNGMGENPGLGVGGKAKENGGAKTAYQPEKSPTALTQGKLLMQWKSDEVSEPGKAREDYLSSLQLVKQGVSEAIRQEQTPPGYQNAIQKYFDSLSAPPINAAPANPANH